MRFAALILLLSSCTPPPKRGPFVPGDGVLRRLTVAQIEDTLRDRFGDTLVLPPPIEPDVVSESSVSIGASHAGYSSRGVERALAMAESVAQQVTSEALRGRVVECIPSALRDDACVDATVRRWGRALWRRPLDEEEVQPLVTLAGVAAETTGDFFAGLAQAFGALLLAPDFLFRVEVLASEEGAAPLDAYPFASRLAFFLWGVAPDDALLDAAGRGALDDSAQLRAEVRRMLDDPKARRGLRSFVSDWLRLDRLDALSLDAVRFPSFSPELGAAAREEVLRTAEDLVFDRGADVRTWLTLRTTFVNRRLAALYGVPFPERGAPHDRFVRIELPANGARVGLLGTAAFLAGNAHPTATSPTLRGKFVSQALLCRAIPDPPVNLNTAIPEPSAEAITLRDRLRAHAQDPGCASCHKLTDPQGLAFEAFDAIGRHRWEDEGAPIDASGTWNGVRFADAAELSVLLARDERFPRCVTTKLLAYGLGRVLGSDDLGEVDRLHDALAAGGYRLRGLLEAIAMSASFRAAHAPDALTTEAP
ncbi:MAG: DUF1592 domain-containing protein [Deltaproteobacteria bacterium]|nr:DUF1592 domain-containing protein [Deltaproteobacteria bacterium]